MLRRALDQRPSVNVAATSVLRASSSSTWVSRSVLYPPMSVSRSWAWKGFEPSVDYELEHFRINQLADVAMRWASELSKPVRVCHECVICETTSLISSNGNAGEFKAAFNKIMRLNGEAYRLSKNVEWGSRLADHVIEPKLPETKGGVFSMPGLSKIENSSSSSSRMDSLILIMLFQSRTWIRNG